MSYNYKLTVTTAQAYAYNALDHKEILRIVEKNAKNLNFPYLCILDEYLKLGYEVIHEYCPHMQYKSMMLSHYKDRVYSSVRINICLDC